MLWSQIKLTPISAIYNSPAKLKSPGTGNVLTFSAGHISYGLRLASVYDNIFRCPTGHRTTRLQTFSIALDLCMLCILSCSSEMSFSVYIFCLQKWYMYINAIWTSENTRRISTVDSLTHKTSSNARTVIVRDPTAIVRCPDGYPPIHTEFFSKSLVLFKRRMMVGRALFGARAVAVEIIRLKF